MHGAGVAAEVAGWWGGHGEADGVRGVLGGGHGAGYVFVGGDDFFGELMMVMIVPLTLKFFARDERLQESYSKGKRRQGEEVCGYCLSGFSSQELIVFISL